MTLRARRRPEKREQPTRSPRTLPCGRSRLPRLCLGKECREEKRGAEGVGNGGHPGDRLRVRGLQRKECRPECRDSDVAKEHLGEHEDHRHREQVHDQAGRVIAGARSTADHVSGREPQVDDRPSSSSVKTHRTLVPTRAPSRHKATGSRRRQSTHQGLLRPDKARRLSQAGCRRQGMQELGTWPRRTGLSPKFPLSAMITQGRARTRPRASCRAALLCQATPTAA